MDRDLFRRQASFVLDGEPGGYFDVLEGAKRWKATDFAANKDIIVAGMAWGAMPEHLVREELARGELVPIHVEGIEPRLSQLYLIRRTDKSIGSSPMRCGMRCRTCPRN